MALYVIAYRNGLVSHDGVALDMPDYKNILTDWFANYTDMPAPLIKPYRIYWEELRALYKYASSITVVDDEELNFVNIVMKSMAFIFDNFGILYDKYDTEFYIEVR